MSLDRSLLDLNHGRCTSYCLDRSFYLINAATGSRHTEFLKKWTQGVSQPTFKTLGARLRWEMRRLECLILGSSILAWRALHSRRSAGLMIGTNVAVEEGQLESRWRDRKNYWRRKLGRLRLGVEPIDEQLAKYRRVTWGLTAVPSVLAVMFFTLFTVFGRPDVGLILVAILLLPIILGAWLDYALLSRRARQYLVEEAAYVSEKEQMTSSTPQATTTSEPG